MNGINGSDRSDDGQSWYNGVVVDDPYYGYGGSAVFGDPGKLDMNLSAYEGTTQQNGDFIPDPVQLEELKARSLQTMLPMIRSEMSLLNSIIELKDFKSLPKIMASVLSLKVPKSIGKSLRELLRRGSDVYLQKEFNIDPLLSDISSLLTAVSRAEKRLNDLITRSGKRQCKHLSVHWLLDVDKSEKTARLSWPDKSWPLWHYFWSTSERIVINEPATFHAQIEYNYNYTQYQVEHARLLSILDKVGINFNPQIIWNAIPWSFVVDWVFGVSRWLGQFKEENMAPMINIHRYLWSYKRARMILCSRKLEHQYAPYTPPNNHWVPMPTVYWTTYKRVVGIPTASSIQSSGLSSKEFSLGAALVLARRRRPKRR
jgi:hypothetical protein